MRSVLPVWRRVKFLCQRLICQRVLALQSHSEWGLFHLANAYAEHGLPEQAIPLWQQVCARGMPRPAALRNLGTTLIRLGRPAEAVVPLELLAGGADASADTHALLGLAYQRAQSPLKAITAYEKALALKPDHQALCLTLGLLLEHVHQDDRALDCYRQITDPSLRSRAVERIAVLASRWRS